MALEGLIKLAFWIKWPIRITIHEQRATGDIVYTTFARKIKINDTNEMQLQLKDSLEKIKPPAQEFWYNTGKGDALYFSSPAPNIYNPISMPKKDGESKTVEDHYYRQWLADRVISALAKWTDKAGWLEKIFPYIMFIVVAIAMTFMFTNVADKEMKMVEMQNGMIDNWKIALEYQNNMSREVTTAMRLIHPYYNATLAQQAAGVLP